MQRLRVRLHRKEDRIQGAEPTGTGHLPSLAPGASMTHRVMLAHAALREGGRRGQEAGGRPLFDAAFLPAQLGFAIVLISIRVGSRRRGVLLTPSTIPLILIGAGLFTSTLGLWSDSPSLTTVLAGAAFLIAAIGMAAYLAPRAVLLLTQSGATPALRRTILWPEVSGLVVSPNGASLLPSKVVVAVTPNGSRVLHPTAGYSLRAVDRRRVTLDNWRSQCLAIALALVRCALRPGREQPTSGGT